MSLKERINTDFMTAFKAKEMEYDSITVENFSPQRMVNPTEYAGL